MTTESLLIELIQKLRKLDEYQLRLLRSFIDTLFGPMD